MAGHPLYAHGLQHVVAQEVINSPWAGEIEESNRVHPKHIPDLFSGYRHFILPFKDETFECLFREMEIEIYQKK